MELKLSEWFNRDDQCHLRAFAYFQITNELPPDWPCTGVWADPNWEHMVAETVNCYYPQGLPDHAWEWADEYVRLKRTVSRIAFPGYFFDVTPIGDEFCVQVSYKEVCETTGMFETKRGVRWPFPARPSEEAVLKTCLRAVSEVLLDRARENFTYSGEAVFHGE